MTIKIINAWPKPPKYFYIECDVYACRAKLRYTKKDIQRGMCGPWLKCPNCGHEIELYSRD